MSVLSHRKFLLTFFVLLFAALLLVGCQGERVEEGFAQEYVSFLEIQKNGVYQMWLRYDNVASYCFDDKALYDKVMWFIDHYPDGISRLHYKGIFKNDPLYEKWYESNDSGCSSLGAGSDGGGGTEAFRLIDICIMEASKVLGEDTPNEYYCETIPDYLLPAE